MTQKKTPSLANDRASRKSITGGYDNTVNLLSGQGFCATCPYFRAAPLDSGRVRRVCRFTGERLPLVGNPLCEMQGGNHE